MPLCTAPRLSGTIAPQQRAAFLSAAASALSPGVPAPVAIGGCRALAALCPKVSAAEVRPLVQQLYEGESAACRMY